MPDFLALLVAAALVSAIAVARFVPWVRWLPVVLASGAVLVAMSPRWGRTAVVEAEVSDRPIEVSADGYVSSSACRACHPHEYATWHDSYHRSMTQRAGPGSIVADWHGVTLTAEGKQWRLERRGDEHWIHMDDPVAQPPGSGGRVARRVVMTTGSHQMQVYWYQPMLPGTVEGPARVLGLLPFTWLIAERRWIQRVDSFVRPSADGVEHGLGAWSLVCIKCHATHGRPRLDWEGGLRGADTHVGELGIACESCHGPGATHVATHRNPAQRYAQRFGDEADPTIVNPRRLAHDRTTQVCGQCHGQFDYQFNNARSQAWSKHGFAYRAGDDVLKDRKLKFDGEEQFWSDGLIRIAGREYNALVGSGCYEKGKMSCLSCHVMHQPHDDARPRAEWAEDQLRADDGDRSCLQCHPAFADDVAAHTHHEVSSTGSRCQNCHMPHTTYSLLKAVRTHRIQSPSVASTIATGRPNACNQCHLDRTLSWTAGYLKDWYGIDEPPVTGDEATIAAGVLWALKGNAAQRALVAWSLGWEPALAASGRDWQAPLLAELVDDPYGAIRLVAERSLRALPGHAGFRLDASADAAARRALKEGVLAAWREVPRTAGAPARPEVLLDAGGVLRTNEVARLLAKRDHRVMRLQE